MDNTKTIMKVKILNEYGFDEAMLAIAMNKKKYDRDMYPVSKKLAIAGSGHDKFLEMITVYLDYSTTRSIHQQIDTYRVGVTKSSESTHHMLIEDVLETCINRRFIKDEFKKAGYIINCVRCVDGLPPINNTALLIAKLNQITNLSKVINNELPENECDFNYAFQQGKIIDLIQEYANKYLFLDSMECLSDGSTPLNQDSAKALAKILIRSFKIDYEHYYAMFEGGSEAITKDTVDRMVELAMTLEEDRYGKLHKLKRILPEGFIQRRIMCCNYQVLKTMMKQRLNDPFDAWKIFCREIIMQVKHPEYFQDVLDLYHTNKEELTSNMCNGKKYIQGY